jgi:hypothetical protein
MLEAEPTRVHSAAGRIRSIEKKSISSGTRTGYLSGCSIVPQPTTVPRAQVYVFALNIYSTIR